MSIEKLVPFAIVFVLIAALNSGIPNITNAIRRAEFQLIQDSKASKWAKAPVLK